MIYTPNKKKKKRSGRNAKTKGGQKNERFLLAPCFSLCTSLSSVRTLLICSVDDNGPLSNFVLLDELVHDIRVGSSKLLHCRLGRRLEKYVSNERFVFDACSSHKQLASGSVLLGNLEMCRPQSCPFCQVVIHVVVVQDEILAFLGLSGSACRCGKVLDPRSGWWSRHHELRQSSEHHAQLHSLQTLP